MKELLILLFLVLIFCIKLLRKNNENFESSTSTTETEAGTETAVVTPNPLIKEASKNIDSDYSDEITPKYYRDNPEMKSTPAICDLKKAELKKGLPADWKCYLDESGNGKSYLYNMYLGEQKYIYHIDDDLKKLFDEKYKPHLDNQYDDELDVIMSGLINRIPVENRDKKKKLLMYHILFNTNLMHRILNTYSEYPAKLPGDTSISNHTSLKTLLRKQQNTSIRDIPKSDLIKLVMDNLHKSYSESKAILSVDPDPIKACLKVLNNDTKCFIDFLADHENKEISQRTDYNYDTIYKSTLGKEYNIIMDEYV